MVCVCWQNIAAFEEYTARIHAAGTDRGAAASNQYEYGDAGHGSAASLGGREIDPDNMTYDELLQLGEENGDVKKERWRQMAVHVISCLPTHRWSGGNNADLSYVPYSVGLVQLLLLIVCITLSRCIICQYKFAQDDRALTLPCAHVFHEGETLLERRVCVGPKS